jgi:hypothetical protein
MTMTTEITVNRNIFYLTTDNFRIETANGYIEHEDKFVAFWKKTPADAIVLGEQIKSENAENIVFSSRQEAKDYAVEKLEKSIYPPDYYHPLDYTKENLSEIMHKQLIFDIGQAQIEDIKESIRGKMIDCTLASNPPFLPGTATIITTNGITKKLTFFEIKRIRRN